MSEWGYISEEASIVLVGNMNPKIFHPEWFIRREIVSDWDYSNDEVVNVADFSQLSLPGNIDLAVFLNKFTMRTTLSSNFLSLQEIVSNIFTLLGETPIEQVGMNYIANIKVNSIEKWIELGKNIAPHEHWLEAIDYISELPEEKQKSFGLWNITMNLPRNDDYNGQIRPNIVVTSPIERTLRFNVNDHINIGDPSSIGVADILDDCWEQSLATSKKLISNILDLNLQD